MRFLFVMDPPEGLLPDKDTSFAFARGAQARGHTCLHCLPHELFHEGAELAARARELRVSDAPPHTTLGSEQTVSVSELDAVFVRTDPPFDVEYLHLTQQLDLVRDRTLVINEPRALRDANEKLYAFHFAHLMPRTLVSSNPNQLLAFTREVGGRGVIKPLDGAGGSGVLVLSTDDKNARSIVDIMTDEGKRHALVQQFLPAVSEGDKRVLMLDGEPMGAILRVPREDDIRANIHVGGDVHPTELTKNELELVGEVGQSLKEAGLYFVGLDLIGERLIEVNVTSPTGIQELGRNLGTRPEEDVIAWVERRVTD